MRSFGKKSCWNATGLRGKKCDLRSFLFHLDKLQVYIPLYVYIAVILYCSDRDLSSELPATQRTRSLKAVSETAVDTSAKIAGMSF